MFKVGDPLGAPVHLLAHENGYLYDGGEQNGDEEGGNDGAAGQKNHHEWRQFQVILSVVYDEHRRDEVSSI